MGWLTDPSVNVWFQQFRSALLDTVFHGFAWLGDEAFYIIALACVYWVVGRTAGTQLSLVMLTGFWLNSGLKHLFAQPRPSAPGLVNMEGLTDPGLPSGHAQSTTTFWGYAALMFRRRWLWSVGVIAVLLASVSRLYLGMHTPLQVMAGWGFGVLFLLVAWRAAPVLQRWMEQGHWAVSMLIVLAYTGLLFAIHHYDAEGTAMLGAGGTAVPLGALAGFGLGHVFGSRLFKYEAAGPVWWQIVKTVVGLAVLFGLRVGLKPLMPAGYFGDMLRYAAIGLGATLLLPWVYTRLRPGRAADTAATSATASAG